MDALLGIMHKLGIRAHNLPDKNAFAVLQHHVRQHYGGHTVEEIRLAFDMAMTAQLDGDFKCYENFSCDYFSRVMYGYRAWAKQEFGQLPAPPPIAPVREQMSNFAMLRWLAQEIRFIKTGKPFQFIPVALYDYLDKRGKIITTGAEKRIYLEKAASWRELQLAKEVEKKDNVDNRRALGEFARMRQDGFTQREWDRLTNIAKKLLFFDLVQKIPNANR